MHICLCTVVWTASATDFGLPWVTLRKCIAHTAVQHLQYQCVHHALIRLMLAIHRTEEGCTPEMGFAYQSPEKKRIASILEHAGCAFPAC